MILMITDDQMTYIVYSVYIVLSHEVVVVVVVVVYFQTVHFST